MTEEPRRYDASQVEGDLIEIQYIPLSELQQHLSEMLWQENPRRESPKKHDRLGKSIETNGFVNPAKWDSRLNGGKGGIIYGNQRMMALVEKLVELRESDSPRPRGIGILKDSGEWAVPIKIGADFPDERSARRYAIDDNNLTLVSEQFDAADIARLYDPEAYYRELEYLMDLAGEEGENYLPASVSDDEMEQLLELVAEAERQDASNRPIEEDKLGVMVECPNCKHQFLM